MDNEQSYLIYSKVNCYLSGETGRGFDRLRDFQSLVQYIKSELQDLISTIEEDDLLIVTAMCLFGPVSAGIPPSSMRNELLNKLRELISDEQERLTRVIEFAMAYGCGKWRMVREGCNGWEHWWGDALIELKKSLNRSVKKSYKWLCEHIVKFPEIEDNTISVDADVLAIELIKPEDMLYLDQGDKLSIRCTDNETKIEISNQNDYNIPPGAMRVFTLEGEALLKLPKETITLSSNSKISITAGDGWTRIRINLDEKIRMFQLHSDQIAVIIGPLSLVFFECSCGNPLCVERHRLEKWDTTRVSLWHFVASAIKGPMLNIRTVSFAQGMYFSLLARERFDMGWRLRLVLVQYKICSDCMKELPSASRKYEGNKCFWCEKTFDPGQDQKIGYDRLVIVGIDPPVYDRLEVLRCKDREKHYQKLMGNLSTNKLTEKWDNLYDISADWRGWDSVCEAKKILRSSKRMREVSEKQGVDEQELRQKIQRKLDDLKCPLCGGKAPERSTIIWTRILYPGSLEEPKSQELLDEEVENENKGGETYDEYNI